MIEKIISIKNIGRFRDCSPRGDVAFRKLTLLFAENGRGKTTLCAILRSLMTGQYEFISERRTLGTNDLASTQIRIGGNTASFANGTWSGTYPDIAIFDSVFIHDNVYAGDYVDHDHKKNLYRIIVGARGVQLAKQIEDLDGTIRRVSADINTKKEVVTRTLLSGVAVDAYLAWQPVGDIDIKIEQKSVEITNRQRVLEKAAEIQSKGLLTQAALPEFPPNFLATLAKQLTDIATDAESRVRQQVSSHNMGGQGEIWLFQGLGYAANDQCPFCGQDTNANDLIEAYKSHFNTAYKALKQEVAKLSEQVNETIGDPSLAVVQQTFSGNLTLVEFWKQFAETTLPNVPFDEVQKKYAVLRNLALALAEKKQQTPIDTVSPDNEFQDALNAVKELGVSVEAYNQAIAAYNEHIKQQKSSVQDSGSINALKAELTGLEARKKRFNQVVVQACKAYQEALSEKTSLEQQKNAAKQQLDQHCENIIQPYEHSINEYLTQFNTGFRIVNTKHDYRGGTPRSLFQIQINKTSIDIGDSKTSTGIPCFKTALSSGDRSALALAFFLAALKQDTNISSKIVVLDDPFTSLDRFRRECTSQLIVTLANTAHQVVVLSHDPAFLKLVQDNAVSVPLKELQILKTGRGSVISEWNADEATKGAYLKSYSILLHFHRERVGDLQQVAQAIRPFLEEFYRTHFPGDFPTNEWLGDFIGKVRDAGDDNGLAHVKTDLDKLEAINQYSKKFHHSNMPDIDNDELHGFVVSTLSLVGGVNG